LVRSNVASAVQDFTADDINDCTHSFHLQFFVTVTDSGPFKIGCGLGVCREGLGLIGWDGADVAAQRITYS
jgi:hypothetical protein